MRQSCRFAFTLALVASWPLSACAQSGQASAKSAPAEAQPSSDEASDRPIQPRDEKTAAKTAVEVKPDVQYLRDRDGRLVPVPGISYEEFIELFRLKERLVVRPEVPRYAIREMIASGQAAGDSATIQMQLRLRLNEAGWTAVPLGLSECTLSGEVNYRGGGDYFIHYDGPSNEYIVWLKGEPRTDHDLTFTVIAPIAASGDSTSIQLSLPKAAASKLVLDVPGNVTAKTTAPQAVLDVTTIDDSLTRISAIGVSGKVSLAWSPRDLGSDELPLLLETTGAILVTIGGRSVLSEVTLTVRSFGREFQEFRVRLPNGSILGANQPLAAYTLSSVGAAAAPMVHVKLDKKTTGPVEVKFTVERNYDVTKPNETLELAGFDIVEAPAHRQGGQIGVIVAGDWQVKWDSPRTRVRQIDKPAPQLDRRGLLAVFEYVGHKCSLPARIAPRQTRVSVEPEYIYHVDDYETRLDARLKYSIRGAKVFSFELDLPGWTLDEVGPPTIVDSKTLSPDEDARLIVPLLEPTTGDVEITVKARRAHSRNPDDLQLHLPTLVADSPKPATVVISLADNVELATRTDQLLALSPQGIPPGLNLPSRRQPPLVFRAERSPARYVAGLTVRPQKISVRVAASARLLLDRIEVEQRLNYQALYEPLDRLNLVAPASFAAPRNWQVSLGDRRLLPAVVATNDDRDDTTRYQISLGAPRLGQIELLSRFSIPLQPVKPLESQLLDLPLPMPLEGELTSNTLALEMDQGLIADLRSGSWTRGQPADQIAGARRLLVSSPTAATSVPLSLTLEERRPVAGSVVERGFIQSWLFDDSREERAVFRIRSRASAVNLTLPPEVSTTDLEVMLDNRPVQPVLNGQRLAVAWPADEAAHLLELRYRFVNVESTWLSSPIVALQFDDDVHVRRTYWQLVVPGDRHLLMANAATPEFQWQWHGLALKRLNLLDPAELEFWATGAEPAADVPIPSSANVYLFSATRAQVLDPWIARRSAIVLAASAVVLAVAFLFMRFAILRTPWALAGLGILLFVLALAFPDLAIVLGQASIIGLLLATLAVLLRGAGRRETPAPAATHAGSSFVRDRSVTELYYQPPPPVIAPASTTSGGVAIERSASESHAG